MTETKWCPHCKAERPLPAFYPNRAAASGVDGYCKEYRKEQARERARRQRVEAKERRQREEGYVPPARFRTDLRIDDGGRACASCGLYRPWTEYHIDTKAKTGHQSSCKRCVRARQRNRMLGEDAKAAARKATAEYRKRKRGPDWKPSHVTRHAQLECDGAQHRCSGCDELRPLAAFPRNSQTPCGFDPRCKRCREERRSERRTADHNGIRGRELDRALARFGLTGEDYLWLLAQQDGGCALCAEPEAQGDQYFAGKKRLAVDHDHDHCGPGRACKECIRGLLCHNCNVGLGMFEAKPQTRGVFGHYLSRRPFLD